MLDSLETLTKSNLHLSAPSSHAHGQASAQAAKHLQRSQCARTENTFENMR